MAGGNLDRPREVAAGPALRTDAVKPSAWRLPLTKAWPPLMYSVSPGPATTRLMKLTLALVAVGRPQAWSGFLFGSPQVLLSEPAGGWKTTTSPTSGALKRLPRRLTSTRWPIFSVGTIDSLGILYGLIRNAWMASAKPSATTTMTMSSTNELPADFSLLGSADGGAHLTTARSRRLPRPEPQQLPRHSHRGGLDALSIDDDLLGRHTLSVDSAFAGGRLGLELCGGIVKQTCLHDLLRADVAALANAGSLADAVAEVVELRAANVTASGDLDLLDLRRVHGERALHADAEGLLADREGLARTVSLALDHHAFEDLRAATRALDNLEVDADAIARLEAGDAAQLGALKGFDDSAHGKEKARRSAPRVGSVMVAEGAAAAPLRPVGPSPTSGRRDLGQRSAVASSDIGPKGSGPPPWRVSLGSGSGGRAVGPTTPRSWLRIRRQVWISSWWPDSSTGGTFQPRYSAGRV